MDIEPSVRFHNLQKTFTTIFGMLGRYSAEFMPGVYTNVTKEMQKDAAKKIGGFMAEVM
ncbi:MAG: hypothetical protein HFG07_00995 [Oscillibacter sp.]|nr:hypothetical protein [Oscillibacter sp.]